MLRDSSEIEVLDASRWRNSFQSFLAWTLSTLIECRIFQNCLFDLFFLDPWWHFIKQTPQHPRICLTIPNYLLCKPRGSVVLLTMIYCGCKAHKDYSSAWRIKSNVARELQVGLILSPKPLQSLLGAAIYADLHSLSFFRTPFWKPIFVLLPSRHKSLKWLLYN